MTPFPVRLSPPLIRRGVSRLIAGAALILASLFLAAPLLGQSAGPTSTSRPSPAAPLIPREALNRASSTPTPPTPSALSRFDSSTRLLIETELRDATPAERVEWNSILNGVQADQVPYLLEARRKARSRRGGSQSTSATPSATLQASLGAPIQEPTPSDPSRPGPALSAPALNGPALAGPALPHLPPQLPATQIQTVTPTAAIAPPSTFGSPAFGTIENARALDSQFARPIQTLASEPPLAPPQSAPLTPPPQGNFATPSTAVVRVEETASTLRRALMSPLRTFRGDTPPPLEPAPSNPVPAPVARREPRPAPPVSAERSSPYLEAELQRLIAVLKVETAQSSDSAAPVDDRDNLRRHVSLRLLQIMAGEPEQALAGIPGVSLYEQEFWTQVLWLLSNELEPTHESDAVRLARTVDLLTDAARQARTRAPLEISPACFCHKITSFGSYERFAQDEFRAGQPVLVYAELRNFASERTSESRFRTRLRSAMEIVSLDGEQPSIADRRDLPVTEDLCRSPRTDYFHSYRLDLPPQLPPGRYVLRLSLVDEISRKSAACELPFVVR